MYVSLVPNGSFIDNIDNIRLEPIVGRRCRYVSGVSNLWSFMADTHQHLGIVSLSQFWLKGRTSFLACRALLGCDDPVFIFLQYPDDVHDRLLQGGYAI